MDDTSVTVVQLPESDLIIAQMLVGHVWLVNYLSTNATIQLFQHHTHDHATAMYFAVVRIVYLPKIPAQQCIYSHSHHGS